MQKAVIKYADNILKNFATSVSIVVGQELFRGALEVEAMDSRTILRVETYRILYRDHIMDPTTVPM